MVNNEEKFRRRCDPEPPHPSPEGTACDSPARKCGVGREARSKSRRDGTSSRALIIDLTIPSVENRDGRSSPQLQILALTLSFVVAPLRGTGMVARFSFTRLLDASCTAVPVPFDAVNS